ncbi:MAG: PASTA domain-containing protein [Bacteroidia bacterium]|nr:PASTA domain-containing protein [Bacteroidia bacterium]
MKKKSLFRDNTLLSILSALAIVFSILLIIAISYFYIYLPNYTNHGESVIVPELNGIKIEELDSFLVNHKLRYELNDSAYSGDFPPLTVVRQFPKPGSYVKEDRKIYISINRVSPPTVPIPDLVDRSRINAEVVLKSNELIRGRILYEPSPFLNLVKELRYQGKPIEVGVRVPKGSVIDIVIGDGNGSADFTMGNLIGDAYEQALYKINGWNLHLGDVEIPEGVDTTGVIPFVYKQIPLVGDSVRVGDPVTLWLAPKGYVEPEEEIDEDNQ